MKLSVAKKTILGLCLLISMVLPNQLQAQVPDSTKMYLIKTTDGNQYVGTILERNEEQVTIRTQLVGDLTLRMTLVKSIEIVESDLVLNGEYWSNNLLSRRYFYGPNAFTLKKGEGYYQNTWIFLNQVSFGLTDNFTLGGGLIPLFLFGGAPTPVWLTPKLAFKGTDKFHFGAGGLFATIIGDNSGSIGVAYGIGTFGTPDANLTVGLGYGYAGNGWSDRPTLSVSGMVRTGKRGYLMAENYFFSLGGGDNIFLSLLGGRTVWENVSLDYGLLFPVGADLDVLIAIPWLSLTIPFRTKQPLN